MNVMTIVNPYQRYSLVANSQICLHSQCQLLEIINSDSYSHFNIAFFSLHIYTTCIIKVYLFEFNKLIKQFWIQIIELNLHFNFLYKIRKTRKSDVKLLVFLRICWWQVANYCHSRFCLLSEKTLIPHPHPLFLSGWMEY